MHHRTTRAWRGGFVVAALLAALLVAGGAPTGAAVGDDVRINEIQVVGSHNSYKVLPSQEEQDLIRSVIGAGADLMQYEHQPLAEQFESQKVRQIELDIWVDSAGGRYSLPLLRDAVGLGEYHPEVMDQPGIKVFHVQDVDYGSTCLTLVRCLQEVKAWSDANPGHVPISILLEMKDSPLVVPGFTFTEPEPWTGTALDDLDAEIRSVFPDDQVITPDDVRGSHPTLRDAVLTDGWPTLGDSRGKVMFMMDNSGGLRSAYLAGHPSLEGRMLFTNADPGDDDAAFIKRNNAFDASIPGLVAQGYLVRTRADSDTEQARANDTSTRDAALASGAHYVSTDYQVPGIAVGFTTDYVVEIPGGTVARCNPVNGPDGCVDAELDLAHLVVAPVVPPTRPPGSVPGPSTTVPTSTTAPTTPTTAPGSTTSTTVGSSTTTSTSPQVTPTTGRRPRPAPSAPPATPRYGSPAYTG